MLGAINEPFSCYSLVPFGTFNLRATYLALFVGEQMETEPVAGTPFHYVTKPRRRRPAQVLRNERFVYLKSETGKRFYFLFFE